MVRHEVLTTRDEARWRALLPATASASGSVEYARVLERHAGGEARLFHAWWDGAAVAYPFVIRPVGDLPFASRVTRLFDTFTAEYSGPRWLRAPAAGDAGSRRFAAVFAGWCRENGVVAEFAHLGPWTPPELLDAACVVDDREIVYVDLTQGEKLLWERSLTPGARRNVKQAARSGVTVRRAASREDVAAFGRVFESTMDRHNAHDRYRLPLEYFVDVVEELSDHAFIALAEHDGRVVAGGLFLHDATEVNWHLSAMDRDSAAVRPVNALGFDTIQWASRAGLQRMLCGGGYRPGDGVERFKGQFSPLRARFRTYQRVHDPAAYQALANGWSAHHRGAEASAFFPRYRAAPLPRAHEPVDQQPGVATL